MANKSLSLLLNNFSSGLHTEVDASQLPLGMPVSNTNSATVTSAADMLNVLTDRGSLRVRPGMVLHDTLAIAHPKGLAEYYREDATDGVGDYILAATDTAVYESTYDTDGDQSFRFPTTTGLVITSGETARFAQGGDVMYMTDSVQPVQTWDGTTARYLTQLAKPTQDIILTINKVDVNIIDTSNIPQAGTAYVAMQGQVDWGCDGVTFITNPSPYDIWDTSNMVSLPYNLIATPAADDFLTVNPTNYVGCYMRQLVAQSDGTDTRPLVALEILMPYVNSSSETAKWFTKTVRRVGDSLNLASATKLSIRYKVLGGGGTFPGLSLQLGEADEPWLGGTHDPTRSLSYTHALTGDTFDTWYEEDWTIGPLGDDIPSTSRDAVMAIGVQIDTTDTDPVARLEAGVAGLIHATTDYAIYLLIDYIKADVSGSSFILGQEYDFCYTYVYADGQESSASTVKQAPIATVGGELPVTIGIAITKDDGCTAIKARIYGRGGILGSVFILIAEVVF